MSTSRFKVGVTIHPQHGSVHDIREAWKQADALGVDSIWIWDHFFPLYGDPDGNHFECFSLLAAMALETSVAQFGPMVTCTAYRNPDLIAYIAGTIDQISKGRFVLGLGAGWFERDFDEFGYPFGEARDRLRVLRDALPRIKSRIQKLKPGPAGPMPILIGGGGEKVTLRLVAEHASMWNAFGPPDDYSRKSKILEEWCRKIGRDHTQIERTANVGAGNVKEIDDWLAVGLQHFVIRIKHPFEFKVVERYLKAARV